METTECSTVFVPFGVCTGREEETEWGLLTRRRKEDIKMENRSPLMSLFFSYNSILIIL